MLVVSFVLQMDPDNKPTREELKEEVLKVSKGLVGLGGFNLVSASCPHYRTLLLVLVCAMSGMTATFVANLCLCYREPCRVIRKLDQTRPPLSEPLTNLVVVSSFTGYA